MAIMITGADGFIGKNFALRLREAGHTDILAVTRTTSPSELEQFAARADFVFHLAGVNRPTDATEFQTGNADFTARLCAGLQAKGNKAPIVYTSSTQAERDNPYGQSKRAAEQTLLKHEAATGAPVHIYRLTNVFGKWARPNYNSAVATFCHQVAAGVAPSINDPAAALKLVYVDDVVDAFLVRLADREGKGGFHAVEPVFDTTVGGLAAIIRSFADSRQTLTTPRVGVGLERALHATYLSVLKPSAFTYDVPIHSDPRGEFVEMLKTVDSGQFSYFTAHPGITRGEHYHNTKTEKFLVIRGTARFGFRHTATDETYEIETRGGDGRIVETVPGWTHNITNIGSDEMIVMLWANEIFDRAKPDTYARKVAS
jgi:UDP-2-acetamido-2,6-beta-L-arabino-hexul-4-ose reductase